MKLENDPLNFHPIPPRKSYNPFDSDDDALDSPSLNPGNMYLKETDNNFDLKAFEKSSDTVIFNMDNGDFVWEESVLGQPTDKNVTEVELPEFVICYKDSSIKDIGIDEGVASHEKLWTQSANDVSVVDAPKSTQKATSDEINEEALTGQYLVHEFVEDDLLKITELNLDIEDRALPCDQTTIAETEKEKKETAESEISVENEIMPTEEAAANQESGDTQDANKLSYNSKVESKSITFNFRSSANSKPEKQEDEPPKTEAATPPSTQTMTRQEEGASSSSILARPEGRVHGESSFSAGMPVPLPSSIIFSEPLTYSGSISLRSESSAGTASTRSFAFPVLQTDWNTSPTRMGKGQRHAKKHRGWKALSCCKF